MRRAARIFAAGAIALLPMAATVGLLALAVSIVYDWVGPSSLFGSALSKLGFGLGGSEFVSYLVGIGVVMLGVFATGLLVEIGLRHWMRHASDTILGKIPVVRTVYETVSNFVSLLSKEESSSTGEMTPVWCRLGASPGALVLGLLSSPKTVWICAEPFKVVIVPTAPVPIGGGLLFLPAERVVPAEGVGIEALTSIYMSMGVTTPQFLPVAAPSIPPPALGEGDKPS